MIGVGLTVKDEYYHVSKFLAYLLRHGAAEHGLILDQHGFASFDEVLDILRGRYPRFGEEELRRLVDSDAKSRYEIRGGKIRARYGHSVNVVAGSLPIRPPAILYHGTSGQNLSSILKQGLRPMRRQFVHLSMTPGEATQVGRRHSKSVVLFKVHAQKAHESGIDFYQEGNLYLARHIPPAYLEVTTLKV